MKNIGFEKIKPHLLPAVALLALTLAVYARTMGHDFLVNWDDDKYVTANEAVRGFTLRHLREAFTRFYVGNYAPLHIISYMLDYTLWGMRPFGFILTNVLLHAANGLFLYGLIARVAGKRGWAFLASFIFLLHPVQVESVAWVSQRKNVLAMFFFLIAFHLYVSYRERGGEGKSFYAGSVLAFVMSLLSKSVAVIFPVVILLYDLCLGDRTCMKKRLTDKLPYLGAALAVAFVAVKSQAKGYGGGLTTYVDGSPFKHFLTMLPVFARYLGLLFWPANLSAAYDPPIKAGIDAEVVSAALLLVLLGGAGVVLYRRRRDLFFWFALFFVGLGPVSQVLPLVTLMNDRYLYFPMLGAAAFFAGTADLVTAKFPSAGGRKMVTASLVLLLLPLPFLSFRRAEVWKDSPTLWTDATRKSPGSQEAWLSLAETYHDANNLSGALSAYLRVLSLNPASPFALNNIAGIYARMGDLPESNRYLLQLVSNHPQNFKGFFNLGNNYYLLGKYEEAESAFTRASQLDPRSAESFAYLVHVSMKLRKYREARQYYEKGSLLGVRSADVEYDMACLNAVEGRKDEALRHLRDALKLGYRDFAHMREDEDLDSLRALPDFQRLFEEKER